MRLKVAATVQDSFSEFGPCSCCISVTWVLLEVQIPRTHRGTTESESWEVEQEPTVNELFMSLLFMLQFKNHKWRRFISLSTGSSELDSIAQLILHPASNLAVSSSVCLLWGSLDTANNVSAVDFLTDLRKKERTGCMWKLHNGNKESSLRQSLSSCASWASLGHRTVHKHGPFYYTIYKNKF